MKKDHFESKTTCAGIQFSATGTARHSGNGTRIISTSDRSRSAGAGAGAGAGAAFVEIRRLAALNRVLESDIRKQHRRRCPLFKVLRGYPGSHGTGTFADAYPVYKVVARGPFICKRNYRIRLRGRRNA